MAIAVHWARSRIHDQSEVRKLAARHRNAQGQQWSLGGHHRDRSAGALLPIALALSHRCPRPAPLANARPNGLFNGQGETKPVAHDTETFMVSKFGFKCLPMQLLPCNLQTYAALARDLPVLRIREQ